MLFRSGKALRDAHPSPLVELLRAGQALSIDAWLDFVDVAVVEGGEGLMEQGRPQPSWNVWRIKPTNQ